MSVIIIDDHLMNWNGHNANYALSLHEELTRRRLTCLLCGHATCQNLGGIKNDFVPVFRTCAALMKMSVGRLPGVSKLVRCIKANWFHLIDLASRVTALVETRDLVILADCSPRTTASYALWLALLSIKRKHLTVVWLVHDAPSEIMRFEAGLLRVLGYGHSIFIAAMNSAIADRVKHMTALPTFVVPTPQASWLVSSPEPRLAETTSTICYLGGASWPKGFDIFVQAITRVEDLIRAGKLKVICQCSSYEDAPELAPAISMVKRLAEDTKSIAVYASPLPPDEYYRVLSQSDIVVLPYRSRYYRFIQSGVFTEALSLGKPVIVPEGSLLAAELSRIGAGLTFRSEDADSLSQAIRDAVTQVVPLRAESVAASVRYRAWHNAANYVDILLDQTHPK